MTSLIGFIYFVKYTDIDSGFNKLHLKLGRYLYLLQLFVLFYASFINDELFYFDFLIVVIFLLYFLFILK